MKNILKVLLVAMAFASCAVRAGVSVGDNSDANKKGGVQTTTTNNAIQPSDSIANK